MSPRVLRSFLRAVVLSAALALMAVVGAGQALASTPHLSIVARPAPSTYLPGKGGEVLTVISNLGNERVVATEKNPITISETLPEGLTGAREMKGAPQQGTHLEPKTPGEVLTCQKLPALSCTFTGIMEPYGSIEVGRGGQAERRLRGRARPKSASSAATSGLNPSRRSFR